MLKALYDYSVMEGLMPPPGYSDTTVRAYISVSADGKFIDIEEGGTEPIAAPDMGPAKQAKDKCNVLIEKRSVVTVRNTLKNDFFLNALKDGSLIEPMLSSCVAVLESPDELDRICKRLDEKKIKSGDRVSFIVDGESILESKPVLEWWKKFRRQYIKSDDSDKTLCLISGEETVPLITTSKIQGLKAVGGHASGDAIICFDQPAYCSYNLKQGANAPVSEEAYAAVKSALDNLLRDAPKLAGMKFVHWYDCNIEKEYDPFFDEDIFGIDANTVEAENTDETGISGQEDEPVPDESYDKDRAHELRRDADSLIKSVKSGETALISDNAAYYILLLSGVNSRVMIRRYEHGSYDDLQKKIQLWRDDLQLTNGNGSAYIKPAKLNVRLMRLLKYRKNDKKKIFDRMADELPTLIPSVVNSILNGGALPDTVAYRALAFIKSAMMSADEDTSMALYGKDAVVWQWIKVWLIRNKGKRGMIMSEYNPDYKSNAYQCGAIMAVFEAIQRAAMPDVNASIVQRYYSSAIQTPAYVIGTLSKMSRHHLDMIPSDKKYLAVKYSKMLEEVGNRIDPASIPNTLTLTQQSEFAIGYYQMRAMIYKA